MFLKLLNKHFFYILICIVFFFLLQDALIGSLLRLIQRMSSAHKAAEKKEDKGLKKALCPALAIPDDPSVRVSSQLGVNLCL